MIQVMERFAMNIDPALAGRLRAYSKETGISITRLIRDALIAHLNKLQGGTTNVNV